MDDAECEGEAEPSPHTLVEDNRELVLDGLTGFVDVVKLIGGIDGVQPTAADRLADPVLVDPDGVVDAALHARVPGAPRGPLVVT